MTGAIPDSERNILECFDDPQFKIKNRHVVNLDLTCNYYLLTSLPESIGNLTALKNLNVYINQLTHLPKSIGNLIALENLNLGVNKLTTLPKGIGNLIALKNLKLARNQLTHLPESIGNLIALENFNLGINKLTTLPKGIGNLIALKNLNLSQNQLTSLPGSIVDLISLENLDLSKNQLTLIPESIKYLKNVRHLDLRDNPIKTLSNFSRNNLKYSLLDPDFLTHKGKRLYERRSFLELLEYYSKTPENLAWEYISDPQSLTEEEMERFLHEAGRNEEKILENQLPINDPLLKKLVEKDSVELSSGLKIFL